MKKVNTLGAIAFSAILGMTACHPSTNINVPISAGNAVFTNYLAIGNSFTAGAADQSIYITSQLNSFPERLFEQFSTVAGNSAAKGPFIQPLLKGDYGYPAAKYILGTIMDTCDATSSLGPVLYTGPLNPDDALPYVSPANHGQINNIGVPLLRVADLPVNTFTLLNPYAARFYHSSTSSPLDELSYMVHNLYPTFITFWMGPDDILGYALSGGQGIGIISGVGHANPITGDLYGANNITPLDVFEKLYDSALLVATSTGGVSGALINIPDFTKVPFFTTIPVNGLLVLRQTQADSLNTYWQTPPHVLPNLSPFHIGYNNFIIQDNGGVVRQAVPGELILLTTPMANITCYGWGSYTAIPEQYVLTTDEIQFIRTATTTFNDYIYQESLKYHLAYVDMNDYLTTLATGFAYNGINYSASFVTGGAYSLDGINFTPRGYALIANKIITTVNSFYHSTLPLTDANKYQGIQFP